MKPPYAVLRRREGREGRVSAPGIVAYGAYVPPTRLPLAAIGGPPAKEGGPERAVA